MCFINKDVPLMTISFRQMVDLKVINNLLSPTESALPRENGGVACKRSRGDKIWIRIKWQSLFFSFPFEGPLFNLAYF
jgi:hypothetical protein